MGTLAGHAFISYVREDSAEVDVLQQILAAAGIPVWRDTANLWPGEDWRTKIQDAITHDALVFLACFSSRSIARQESYQNEELLLAIEQLRLRRPNDPWLIPVRFDDCDVPNFQLGPGRTLASIQRVDLFGTNRDFAGKQLVTAVLRLLEQRGLGAVESGRRDGFVPSSAPAEGPGRSTSQYPRPERFRGLRQADRESVVPVAVRPIPATPHELEPVPSSLAGTRTPGADVLVFRADGSLLAAGLERGSVRWRLPVTGEVLGISGQRASGDVLCVALSPGGRFLVVGGTNETIELWEAATGVHLRTLKGRTGFVSQVAINPEGSLLASYAYTGEGAVRLWETSSGNPVRTVTCLDRYSQVAALTFSPDGRWLAAGCQSGMVDLWESVTGKRVRTLEGDSPGIRNKLRTLASRFDRSEHFLAGSGLINAIAFSSDARKIAAATSYHDVYLWKLPSGWLERTLEGNRSGRSGSAIAFSPTGRLLAVAADSSLEIWDLAMGEHMRTLQGHANKIRAVAFSPDGHLLASSDADTVRLWR